MRDGECVTHLGVRGLGLLSGSDLDDLLLELLKSLLLKLCLLNVAVGLGSLQGTDDSNHHRCHFESLNALRKRARAERAARSPPQTVRERHSQPTQMVRSHTIWDFDRAATHRSVQASSGKGWLKPSRLAGKSVDSAATGPFIHLDSLLSDSLSRLRKWDTGRTD